MCENLLYWCERMCYKMDAPTIAATMAIGARLEMGVAPRNRAITLQEQL
jgi:hypothetical protein